MTIDQRGAGNSQFGKRYTEDEKRVAAEKTRSLWRRSEYRERVVRGATGLKRSDEFRIGQRERTKASYEKVPGLRESRGSLFSRCWRDGRNHFHVKRSRKSVEEKEVYEHLKALGRYSLSDTEIRLTDGSFVAPDIVIDGKIAIEFYGDYYHANPFVYEDDDYIKVKGKTAKEVRDADRRRVEKIVESGYKVIVLWQRNYRENKEYALEDLVRQIDEALKENC